MNNGQFWNLSLQVRLPPCGEGILFMMTALYRTASCGYCALVPPGLTCRRDAPSSTCCRRFGKWGKTGVFRNIPEALARDPEERGATNLSECFIDGTLVVAKKGRKSGKDQAGQGYEAHGYCRRFRSSARPAHGFCQPS